MSRADSREGWRRTWIVALREIRERGGSRAYRISTVLGVLLVVAVILVPSLLQPSKTYRVGMVGNVPAGTVTALEAQTHAVDHDLQVTRYRPSLPASRLSGTRPSTCSWSTAPASSGEQNRIAR